MKIYKCTIYFIVIFYCYILLLYINNRNFKDWIKHLKITQNYKKKNNAN